jgi:hypothetical protein
MAARHENVYINPTDFIRILIEVQEKYEIKCRSELKDDMDLSFDSVITQKSPASEMFFSVCQTT